MNKMDIYIDCFMIILTVIFVSFITYQLIKL